MCTCASGKQRVLRLLHGYYAIKENKRGSGVKSRVPSLRLVKDNEKDGQGTHTHPYAHSN